MLGFGPAPPAAARWSPSKMSSRMAPPDHPVTATVPRSTTWGPSLGRVPGAPAAGPGAGSSGLPGAGSAGVPGVGSAAAPGWGAGACTGWGSGWGGACPVVAGAVAGEAEASPSRAAARSRIGSEPPPQAPIDQTSGSAKRADGAQGPRDRELFPLMEMQRSMENLSIRSARLLPDPPGRGARCVEGLQSCLREPTGCGSLLPLHTHKSQRWGSALPNPLPRKTA